MELVKLQIDYIKATRCWSSNNLKSCLLICDRLTKKVLLLATSSQGKNNQNLLRQLNQLKQLIWFLKIRCLAEDYYVNESLLLNEDDIENDDDQISVLKTATTRGPSTQSRRRELGSSFGRSRRTNTSGSAIDNGRVRTGILTGRVSSTITSSSSSRHYQRSGITKTVTSSYKPLTTNLTATQTAFSRSTRPLLKYSTCHLLSKLAFEYLYNAQAATNACPDYRQCLEYLNLVHSSIRKRVKVVSSSDKSSSTQLISTEIESSNDHRKVLGTFWLMAFGICYFNLRMSKQAEEYFQQALSLNPKHLDIYTWLIKTYLRSNQLNKVLKTCQSGLSQCEGSSILFNWMARVQSISSDLFAANISLRESLKYDPTNIEALANVGHFAFYSGDKIEFSLKCFERIQQLSMNQSIDVNESNSSLAQLMNNLALCNFYSGFYHKVVPLFMKAFLNSPNKEVTSDIWYNVSFVVLNFGLKNLAMACLKLSLKNNSQNEEAINNLGVLKYNHLIDDDQVHYYNRQELWALPAKNCYDDEQDVAKNLNNLNEDVSSFKNKFDEAETYFTPINLNMTTTGDKANTSFDVDLIVQQQPETLYNMALIKNKRGQLLASVLYSNLYLEHDSENYHIRNLIKDVKQLISHDG